LPAPLGAATTNRLPGVSIVATKGVEGSVTVQVSGPLARAQQAAPPRP
jgi:hypothetical protein